MSDELPEGWASARLNDLLEPGGLFDGPFGSSLKSSDYTDAGVRVIRLENLANLQFVEDKETFVSEAKYKSLTKHTVVPGDIMVGSFVDGAVRVCLLPELRTKAIAKADCFTVRTRRDAAERHFIAFQLGTVAVRDAFVGDIHGATRPRITTKQLRECALAVAPLPEQRRIVAQVEDLLVRVKRAQGRLDKVALILNRFRQAVLAAACSGELTRDWRETHPSWADDAGGFAQRLRELVPQRKRAAPADAELNVPDGWPRVSLGAISTHLTSGSRAWSPYYRDDGFGTFVMAQNVRPMRFDRSHRQGVAPPPSDPERERTSVQQDDILVTIVGANTGDVCRVDVPIRDHFVCQSVALVRPSDPSFSRFLELWLNSPLHGQRLYQEWAYGEGRPHLSFDHLRGTPVAIPGKDEQSEIVRQVEKLFALAETIEHRVQAASAWADKLPQAILSKAFSGELVPTEAELARAEGRTYETAAELLKRTAEGRGASSKPAAKRRAARRTA